MATSPTQLSLKRERELGRVVAVTEHWNSFARIRQDLFGFIDLICLDGKLGCLGIQTTSLSNMSTRQKKINGIKEAVAWVMAGNRLQVHGWGKNKSGRWGVKIRGAVLVENYYLEWEDL